MFTQLLFASILLTATLALAQSPEPAPVTTEASPQSSLLSATPEPQQVPLPPPMTERGTEQSPVVVKIVPPVQENRPEQRSEPVDWWLRSEWWLVIPTWLLAVFSLGLAIYTWKLWRGTSALVKEGADTTRKELRAYVALDDIFFNDERDDAESNPQKISVRNFGQTPAHNLTVWCERASHLPQTTTPLYETPLVGQQMLHPVQRFARRLAVSPLFGFAKGGFFTYGRITYQDIYERWWVTHFGYLYEGEGSFSPLDGWNKEEGPFPAAPF